MNQYRRIALFLFGLLMGSLLVFYFKGERTIFNTPSDVIKSSMVKNPTEYKELALCQQKCLNVTHDDVLKIMGDGNITYSKSDIKAKPHKKYHFDGKTDDGKELTIIFGWGEDRTVVYEITQEGKECECK